MAGNAQNTICDKIVKSMVISFSKVALIGFQNMSVMCSRVGNAYGIRMILSCSLYPILILWLIS